MEFKVIKRARSRFQILRLRREDQALIFAGILAGRPRERDSEEFLDMFLAAIDRLPALRFFNKFLAGSGEVSGNSLINYLDLPAMVPEFSPTGFNRINVLRPMKMLMARTKEFFIKSGEIGITGIYLSQNRRDHIFARITSGKETVKMVELSAISRQNPGKIHKFAGILDVFESAKHWRFPGILRDFAVQRPRAPEKPTERICGNDLTFFRTMTAIRAIKPKSLVDVAREAKTASKIPYFVPSMDQFNDDFLEDESGETEVSYDPIKYLYANRIISAGIYKDAAGIDVSLPITISNLSYELMMSEYTKRFPQGKDLGSFISRIDPGLKALAIFAGFMKLHLDLEMIQINPASPVLREAVESGAGPGRGGVEEYYSRAFSRLALRLFPDEMREFRGIIKAPLDRAIKYMYGLLKVSHGQELEAPEPAGQISRKIVENLRKFPALAPIVADISSTSRWKTTNFADLHDNPWRNINTAARVALRYKTTSIHTKRDPAGRRQIAGNGRKIPGFPSVPIEADAADLPKNYLDDIRPLNIGILAKKGESGDLTDKDSVHLLAADFALTTIVEMAIKFGKSAMPQLNDSLIRQIRRDSRIFPRQKSILLRKILANILQQLPAKLRKIAEKFVEMKKKTYESLDIPVKFLELEKEKAGEKRKERFATFLAMTPEEKLESGISEMTQTEREEFLDALAAKKKALILEEESHFADEVQP